MEAQVANGLGATCGCIFALAFVSDMGHIFSSCGDGALLDANQHETIRGIADYPAATMYSTFSAMTSMQSKQPAQAKTAIHSTLISPKFMNTHQTFVRLPKVEYCRSAELTPLFAYPVTRR